MSIVYEKKKTVLSFREDKPTVYRIVPCRSQLVSFEKLIDEVACTSGINRGITQATVEILLDRILMFMDMGMSVQLGQFGSFKPTIKVKAQTSPEALGGENVLRKKVLFYPGKRFKVMLKHLSVISENSL